MSFRRSLPGAFGGRLINIKMEFEPGGAVLKNKLGIRSRKRMSAVQYEAYFGARDRYWRRTGSRRRLDIPFLLAIHRDFLGSIYEWAGRYRTMNISLGGFTWPSHKVITRKMREFESKILSRLTPCRPGPLGRVAWDMAVVHARLLSIHPFCDGNGRTARLIAELMALQARFRPPDFGFRLRKNRRRYVEAVKKGYRGNYTALAAIMAEGIARADREARRLDLRTAQGTS